MILLVPLNPEVPQVLRPKLWPSLLMVFCLVLGYGLTRKIAIADSEFIESVESSLSESPPLKDHVDKDTESYLAKRPLLSIAPAKKDWDIERLLKANFIHGSLSHLILNSIGIFAGVRICTTFIPFLTAFFIFLVGGSLGLWSSVVTSRQISEFIPHVGASAGLFALMGTYYIFNFKFRTQYFFWLPIRRGYISLRTSWFFFIDVILLELVLSTAQLFPNRLDSIDHIAHVVGFSAGMVLAASLKVFMRWPSFLQTRDEYLYWKHFGQLHAQKGMHKIQLWTELLQINRYNDSLKVRVCRAVKKSVVSVSDEELNETFKFFVPTFVRLNTSEVTSLIKSLLVHQRHLPRRWLSKLPYDILLRVAKSMAESKNDQPLLYRFLLDYKRAQDFKGKKNSNVEKLMTRLELELQSQSRDPSQKVG
jgi:membrane associated rhomboid family serine protease